MKGLENGSLKYAVIAILRLAFVGESAGHRADYPDYSYPENPAAQATRSLALSSLAAAIDTLGNTLAARE